MSTFRSAEELRPLLDEVLKAYRPDLVEAGVKIDLLFAHAARNKETGEPKGPALKLHGVAAAAVVKINGHDLRVEGLGDAVIKVDGDRWPEWSEVQQRSLLDHETHHLVLVRDADGVIKLDDCHRPKLKNKPHDHEIGVFEEVIKRHGVNSMDAQAFMPLHRFVQNTFPWG